MPHKDYPMCFSSSCGVCSRCCRIGDSCYIHPLNVIELSTGEECKEVKIPEDPWDIYQRIMKIANESKSMG
tara:strand:- start:92 stop:304 length:213 start_codon:yes stop_codon:yes gene_type:complete